ncbi:MAG: hypothetical protein M1484_01280 [Patescibacteria group bacterium]|nr:hypothetical protein [Patescibacteria group bacterium]
MMEDTYNNAYARLQGELQNAYIMHIVDEGVASWAGIYTGLKNDQFSKPAFTKAEEHYYRPYQLEKIVNDFQTTLGELFRALRMNNNYNIGRTCQKLQELCYPLGYSYVARRIQKLLREIIMPGKVLENLLKNPPKSFAEFLQK